MATAAAAVPAVRPTFYGRAPPVDLKKLTWADMRPSDREYRRRVQELRGRGGFHAYARLVALHSAPGQDPLLAIELTACGYFPALLLPGALDGTAWQGVPKHLSLCYAQECSPQLLAAALRRWGRRRRVWVSCARVSSGATCVLKKRGAGRGALVRCGVLRQMHRKGGSTDRELHVSL